MSKHFKAQLQSQRKLLGTMLTLNSPDIAELLSLVGFDWIFVDGEHGAFDLSGLKAVLQAVSDRSTCLVRIPAIEEVAVKQVLDIGAAGIIVPQVKTAGDVKRVIGYCKYPPQGSRGIGVGRAHGFGTRINPYLQNANDDIVVVIQAEHKDAVENIDSIVAVDGVDCVLIGPNDLSSSYNKLGQHDDPEIVQAIARVEAACQAADIPLGIFGINANAVQPFFDRGYSLVVAGIDTVLLTKAAGRLLEQMQQDSQIKNEAE